MKLKAIVFFPLIICFSSSLLAQEKPVLFSRIERVFQEKEPTWKVERIYTSDTSDPLEQGIVFRSGEDQASVEVSIWKREKDAQDVFAGHSLGFDKTMGKLDFVHFYKSQMTVSVSSLFSAARLFKRRVFNVMFKNSGFENKGFAKTGLPVSEKWPKSS
jgi:hypothetical protein